MISALWHKSKFNFELEKKQVNQNTSQNSISNFFEKKLCFHVVVLVKTFPLM